MPANVDMNALNRRFPVPEGFRALLEALAREVLRGQPSDIYAFSALFFEKLLQMRKEYDGVNPVKDTELYEKFKIQLFTEALKRRLVSPKLAISMGLDLDDGKLIETHYERRRTEDETDEIERDDDVGKETFAEEELNEETAVVDRQRRRTLEENENNERNDDETEYFREENQQKRFVEEEEVDDDKFKKQPDDDFNDEQLIADDTFAEERAATKIQAEIRGFLTRKNFEKIKHARNSVQHEPLLNFEEPTLKQSRSFDTAMQDLDLDDEDTATAAVKIQAGIRGYLTRQRYNEMKKEQQHAAAKIQAGIRGHLTRKNLEAQGIPVHKSSRSPSPAAAKLERKSSAPESEPSHSAAADVFDDTAAVKIQAGVRGYLTRKRLEQRGVRVHAPRRQSLQPHHLAPPSDVMRQRSGTNPDEEAATKIQAGIRGYLTRKRLKGGSDTNLAAAGGETIMLAAGGDDDEDKFDVENADPETAATKIQAGVRSYLTRVNIKKQKEAATKIQSAFRGHQVRREVKTTTTHRSGGGGIDDENGWENVPSDGEA